MQGNSYTVGHSEKSYASTISTESEPIGLSNQATAAALNNIVQSPSVELEADDSVVDLDEDYFDFEDNERVAARIPFTSVHSVSLPFSSPKRKCFQPGQKINVRITDISISSNSRPINPFVYTIHLSHGDYEWVIRRRYKHFRQMHDHLLLFKASAHLPSLTASREEKKRYLAITKCRLPHFPRTLDRLVDDMDKRKEVMQKYLQGILANSLIRNHPHTLRFLEVSHLSFVQHLGAKWKEGFVQKRSGGHKFSMGPLKNVSGCVGNCRLFHSWDTRWLVLKDTFIMYLNPDTGCVRDVLLMDLHFSIRQKTDNTGVRHGIVISNLSRRLTLKCWSPRQAEAWCREITQVLHERANLFTTFSRFSAFAPLREDVAAKWFVDGATYMAAVADALEEAKEEVFITDWWLSPEVFLKRPVMGEGGRWRLDMLLKKRAEAGVKIFILLYKEMQVALGINSFYSKQTLQDLHPNIKVLRHPDGIALWSHHEKCVVIDQRIAFLGGIDLCYGRWDTPSHRLTDIGSMGEFGASGFGQDEGVLQQVLKEVVRNLARDTVPDRPRTHAAGDTVPDRPRTDAAGDTVPDRPRTYAAGDIGLLEISDQNYNKIKKQNTKQRDLSTYSKNSNITQTKQLIFARDDCSLSDSGSDPRNSETEEEDVMDRSDTDAAINTSEVQSVSCRRIASSKHLESSATRNKYNRSSSLPHNIRINGGGSQTPVERQNARWRPARLPMLRLPVVDETLDSGAPGSRRVQPQSNAGHVIEVLTPYKDTELLDCRERVHFAPENGGQLNTAFVDSECSDVSDRIIYRVADRMCGDQDPPPPRLTGDGMCGDQDPPPPRLTGDDSAEEQGPRLFLDYLEAVHDDNDSVLEGPTPAPATSTTSGYGTDSEDKRIRRLRKRFMKSRSEHHVVAGGEVAGAGRRAARLERQSSVFEAAPVLLNPSQLSAAQMAPLTPYKPSTPPATRKQKQLLKKQEKIQEKIQKHLSKPHPDVNQKLSTRTSRSAFKSNRSKSLGVALQTERDSAVEMQAFRNSRAETADDIINRLTEDETYKLWIGKDYVNFIFKDFVDLDKPYDDFIDRGATPRMPWHDVGVMAYGRGARDVARHFIQRWNFTKLSKRKDNVDYPLLLPKSYQRVPIPRAAVDDPGVVWTNAQVLRSASQWSAGIKYTEASIMNAYVDMISNAKHFIYIENQFFVTIMDHDTVANKIAEALYNRILHAFRARQPLRVIVVLPLLPAFEGELGTSRGAAIQAVTHWNYSSICRGGRSLLERLMNAGIAYPFEYISFYGLRTHGLLNNTLVSELVYVHCKIMIVDDTRTIIGSANINDRSLLGKRDSELALLVEDTHFVSSAFDGHPTRVGKFSHSLRMALFREHLGINANDMIQADITDPTIATFYKNLWMGQAAENTKIYDIVFRCLPCDDVKTFQELKDYQRMPGLVVQNPAKASEMLQRVKGYLVLLPLQFLSRTPSLAPKAGTKESLAPSVIWT